MSQPPDVTDPPAAPSRSDSPADFSSKADAFLAWVAVFAAQIQEVITWIVARVAEISGYATTASNAASTATAAASAAENSQELAAIAANAEAWAAGNYTTGQVAQSTVNQQFYAATSDFNSQTDPALAETGWRQVSVNGPAIAYEAEVLSLAIAANN